MPILWFGALWAIVLLIYKLCRIQKKTGDKYSNILMVLSGLLGFWILTELIILLINSEQIILVLHELKYISIIFSPFCIYGLFRHLKNENNYEKLIGKVYVGLGLIMLGTIASNGIHHQFRRSLTFVRGIVNVVEVDNGPLYYVVVTLTYSLLLYSIIGLLRYYFTAHWLYKNKIRLILVGVLLSVVTNIVFQVVVVMNNYYVDFTSLTFGCVVWFSYYGIYVYQNDIIGKVVADMALDELGVGAMFLNEDKEIAYMNPLCERITRSKQRNLLERSLPSFGNGIGLKIEKIIHSEEKFTYQYSHEKVYMYEVSAKKIVGSKTQILGYLIMFKDITELEHYRVRASL